MTANKTIKKISFDDHKELRIKSASNTSITLMVIAKDVADEYLKDSYGYPMPLPYTSCASLYSYNLLSAKHIIYTSVGTLGTIFKDHIDAFVEAFVFIFQQLDLDSLTMVASSRSQQETYNLFADPTLIRKLKKAGVDVYKKKSTRNSHGVEGYKLFWLTIKKKGQFNG